MVEKAYGGGKTGTQFYMEAIINVDMEKYNIALNNIIQKQPMLRAKIKDTNSFYIEKKLNYEIIIHTAHKNSIDDFIIKKRKDLSHKKFNENDFPFFNFEALKLSENRYYIFFNIDLIIADGQSAMMLSNQIKNEYLKTDIKLENQENILVDSVTEYLNIKKSKKYERSKKFWLDRMKHSEINAPKIYTKENNSMLGTFERLEFFLDKSVWEKFKKTNTYLGLNINSTLLYLFNNTLNLFNTSEKYFINMTVSQRPKKDKYNDLISDFTSTVLVKNDIIKNEQILEGIKRT